MLNYFFVNIGECSILTFSTENDSSIMKTYKRSKWQFFIIPNYYSRNCFICFIIKAIMSLKPLTCPILISFFYCLLCVMLIFKGTLQKERTKRLKFKSECCHRPNPATIVLVVVERDAKGEVHAPCAALAALGTGPIPRRGG